MGLLQRLFRHTVDVEVEIEGDTARLEGSVEEVAEELARIVARTARRGEGVINVSCEVSDTRAVCIVARADEEEGQRLYYYEYNTPPNPPAPSTWYEFDLYIRVDPAHADDAARLVRELLEGRLDGRGVYDAFMDYAEKVEEPYTTRGNKAVIYDSGGDYPRIEVEVEYLG